MLQRYALDRYEDEALRELQRMYRNAKNSVLRDINRAAKRGLNQPSRLRLQSLLKEIDANILALTQKLSGTVAEVVGEAGAYSYTNTSAILSWDGKVEGFNNVALSANQISTLVTGEKLGPYDLDGWLWTALNAENKALKAEIGAAKVRGIGYKKLMGELGSRYDNLFSGEAVKQNLETVVKSYIQSVNAKAHKDLYEANPEVIDEVEWSAIMENGNTSTGRGTCPRCMALDGQRYPTVAKGPTCPLHPRCRCMYVPVTKSWKDLGFDIEERKALDKKWTERSEGISKKKLAYGLTDKDFAGFWKTKPKYWQDNAIGPVRANLVRGGYVDFNKIVYKNGNLIPLDKLGVSQEELALARRRK